MRLTDFSINSLQAPSRGTVIYADDKVPGFGVRVSLGGTKSFVLTHGVRRTRETIGRVGIISLHDARAEAKRRLAEYTLGKTKPKSIAWDAAKEEYLVVVAANCKPRTHHDYSWYLNTQFRFGETRLSDLSPLDIQRKLDALEDRPALHRYAYCVLRAFMRWAYRRHYLDQNPMARMEAPPPVPSRERTLTDQELTAVWHGAAQLGVYGTIVRLLILTGQRREEIAQLTGDMIGEGTITLPSWLTKNGQEHAFPIGPLAQSLLPKPHKNGRLFPARRERSDKAFSGFSKGKAELQKLTNTSDWTLHDLRRTLRTKWAELGVRKEVAERYINHISGEHAGIAGVYNRYSYSSEMQAAVAIWESHLVARLCA